MLHSTTQANGALVAASRRDYRSQSADVDDRTRQASAALAFVYRGALAAKVPAEDLAAALQGGTNLTSKAAQAIAAAYNSWRSSEEGKGGGDGESKDGSGAAKAVQDILSVGKLLKLDWKTGVAVQSSQCKTLKAPYVVLVLHLLCGGKVVSHSVELTVAEFQDVARMFSSINDAFVALG